MCEVTSLLLPRCTVQVEKNAAHPRFDHASGLKFGTMYVYKATIKKLARPQCIKNGLSF